MRDLFQDEVMSRLGQEGTMKMVRYSESGDSDLPATARPVIYGLNHVVSTGHWLTTMAGVRMLMNDGNAFDAAAAATFAAAVVEPTSSFSFGGECVYMLRDARTRRVRSLCGQGGAPQGAIPSFFRDKGLDCIPTGPGPHAPLAFTTPGMVGATLRLLKDFGTKSIQEVMQPAIGYACEGIAFYEYMLSRLDDAGGEQLRRFSPEGAKLFFPDGRKGKAGTILRQSALGRVLRMMADAGAGCSRSEGIQKARRAFYNGPIADALAHTSARVGGILCKTDLEVFQEDYEEPVSGEFLGHMIQCQPFWSQAPVLLQALNILENFDLRPLEFNSPDYIHLVSEALKLAFADREAYYADPKFSKIPADVLLSKEYARARAKLVDLERTTRDLPPAGDLEGGRCTDLTPWAATHTSTRGPETGTTHISIVDAEGNLVACTPSGGAFVKSVFFEDLGFSLSTRLEMLNLKDDHPNCVAPGKRPRTTLVNYIVTGPSGEVMTVGCPGGDAQVQGSLQIMLNSIVWEMDPQAAVEAPRFATMSVPNSFYPHTFLKGRLALEAGFSTGTAQALAAMGHEVAEVATCGMGATITTLNETTGVRATSSDPRRSCHAIGW